MSLAALERAKLLSSAATTEDKRQYLEHLLTLPAYRDPELTSYFAEYVSLHFADVGELQDQAVDAVLDLCEDDDEKTRISGIQALARIGKVEPRWVRGNTGVLLQLLESPPGELKHVRQAIYDLMDVSPSDVFSMMAEDCKGSEDETGASRRNILDFLLAAKEKRTEILESGDYIDAERIFADGFYEVMGTTAIAETRQILGLLLPLSTISGRKATSETTGKYAKSLTKCLHPDSSVGLTSPLIKLWMELNKRNKWMEPRWTLFFLANHGAAVVSLMVEKNDKEARELLLLPTRDPSRLGRSFEYRSDVTELDQRDLLPAFASTMVKSASRLMDQKRAPEFLEVVLYSVFSVFTNPRSHRDLLTKSQSRQFLDLERQADRCKRDAKSSDEAQIWRNVRDMADTLGDRGLKLFDIRPTWESRRDEDRSKGREPTRVNMSTAEPSRGLGQSSASVPAAVSQPTVKSAVSAPPTGPKGNRSGPNATQAPISENPSGLSILSRAEPKVASSSTSAPFTPELNILARSRPSPAASITPVSGPSSGLSILARSKQTSGPAAASVGPSTPGPSTVPALASSGFSIRAHAKNNTPTNGAKESMATPTNQAVLHKPDTGLGIRSAAATITPEQLTTPKPNSLLSRITSGSGSGTKRPREESTTSSDPSISTPRSLADRLRHPSDSKKARQDIVSSPSQSPPMTASAQKPRGSGPSLLSRMSSSSIPHVGLNRNIPNQPSTLNTGFSFKRTNTQAPSMSIAGRAAPLSSIPRSVPPHSGLPGSTHPTTDNANEDGIIRKGRGHARQQDVAPSGSMGFGSSGSRGRELL